MLKRHVVTTATSVALFGALITPANAQIYDTMYNATIMNSNIGAQTTYNRNMDDLKAERRRIENNSGNNGNSESSSIIPSYIQNRVESTSFAVLNSEFSRRITAYGKGSAQQWLNSAARSVGGEMGSLAPEYQRRVKKDGRAQADNWYVGQARMVSQRYVADSGR